MGGAPFSSRSLSNGALRAVCGLGALFGAALLLTTSQSGAQSPAALEYAREPPDEIVTAESCGECHAAEAEVWKRTPHATGFRSLHRTEAAEAIADKMGVRLMKRDSPCLSCHYTPVVQSGQLRAASGVSCESCHGAGRMWIDIHNDYGAGADYASETPEHRQQRIERSRAAGMRRPSDLYEVSASCFECHTVPDEKLVNEGGHTTGSSGFELVEWSQGEIRHNFLQSFLTGDGTENRERPASEKRAMYIVGRALDLEYSLRGAAQATVDGAYAKSMSRRVRVALVELRKIATLVQSPELAAMQKTVKEVRVTPGNRDALLAAADAVRDATQRFIDSAEPERLAALDPLVAGEAIPVPEVQIADSGAPGGPAPDGSSGVPGVPGADPATPGTADGEGTGEGGTVVATVDPGQPAVGEFKRRVRPRSQHATLGPGACSGCHESSHNWWFDDPHFRSAEPFFDGQPERIKIARLYGLSQNQMVQGSQVCMDCHGTVITGNEAFEVLDGVSCESCHGAAGDYHETHRDGDKALGVNRPGYQAALGQGMNELRDLSVRAKVCADCHYVTEPRLISAGHPSGRDFDYVAGMAEVKHWERGLASASSIQTAFSGVLGRRGPVPQVTLARLPSNARVPSTANRGGTPTDLARATGQSWNRNRPSRSRGGSSSAGRAAPGPGPQPVIREIRGLELPPYTEPEPDAPIEEILAALKLRLEQLYRAIAGGDGS